MTSLYRIKLIVPYCFAITQTDLLNTDRGHKFSWPRHVGCWLGRQLTGEPWRAIANSFGFKNHNCAILAARHVQDRMDTEPDTKLQIEWLKWTLTRRISPIS